MLSFRIRAADPEAGWRLTPAGLERGLSFIRPFRHPALEEVVVADRSRVAICVRERCAGRAGPERGYGLAPGEVTVLTPNSFDRLLAELTSWPLQWSYLIVGPSAATRGGDGSAQPLAVMRAGHWGTAPVFVVTTADELRGDWDPWRLLAALTPSDLDPVRAARYLAELDCPYGRESLFAGLHVVTERATARWERPRNGSPVLTVEYPGPWPRVSAGTLREDADPVEAFRTILAASLDRWTGVAGVRVGVELSGGRDSAIVAGTVARLRADPVRSYGLELLGPSAADQRTRRGELTRTFGLADTAVAIADHLPLAEGSGRIAGGQPPTPWEEIYYEAMDGLLGEAVADGTTVLLTGFGGDELCGLRPSELRAMGREPHADPPLWDPVPAFLTAEAAATLAEPLDTPPRGASSASAVECAAYSAARYLRRGIWPVHPLCTPELVRFCARLPAEWRRGRFIERELLSRFGCGRVVTHSRHPDDFSYAIERSFRSAARATVDALFTDPVLAELGLVDRTRLRRQYADWLAEGDRGAATPLYAAAITELCLRRMEGRPLAVPGRREPGRAASGPDPGCRVTSGGFPTSPSGYESLVP